MIWHGITQKAHLSPEAPERWLCAHAHQREAVYFGVRLELCLLLLLESLDCLLNDAIHLRKKMKHAAVCVCVCV